MRDFTQVFDAYAQFEESMISAKMETNAEIGASGDSEGKPLNMAMYNFACKLL